MSRPTPLTQNRRRSSVCLGLLGAFIPPAARRVPAQNMSKLLLQPPVLHPAHRLDETGLWLDYFLIDRLSALSAWSSIHDTAGCQAVWPAISISASISNEDQRSGGKTPTSDSFYNKITTDSHRSHIPTVKKKYI